MGIGAAEIAAEFLDYYARGTWGYRSATFARGGRDGNRLVPAVDLDNSPGHSVGDFFGDNWLTTGGCLGVVADVERGYRSEARA